MLFNTYLRCKLSLNLEPILTHFIKIFRISWLYIYSKKSKYSIRYSFLDRFWIKDKNFLMQTGCILYYVMYALRSLCCFKELCFICCAHCAVFLNLSLRKKIIFFFCQKINRKLLLFTWNDEMILKWRQEPHWNM